MDVWDKWKYKYLTLLFTGFLTAIFLAGSDSFHNYLLGLGAWEYIGALIAGSLFVSSFTVATAIVIIGVLVENIHPLALGLIGGIGAVVGDFLVFKLVKDHLADEVALLIGREGITYIKTVIRSRYIAWTLPIIGALIIASPLPDEFGVSLLGFSKMSDAKFMLISFVANSLGILAIASVARVF